MRDDWEVIRCEWVNCPAPAQYVVSFGDGKQRAYCCNWHRRTLVEVEQNLGREVRIVDRLVVNYGRSPRLST